MNDPTSEQIACAHALGEAILRTAISLGHNERNVAIDRAESLLTSIAVADLLGIRRATLRRLTAPKGPIPAFRIGRELRYSADDLRAWIAQVRVEATETSKRERHEG